MRKISTLLLGMMTSLSANAIELPEIIGDNMMLQQQTEAKLWGWAKPNATVEVYASWLDGAAQQRAKEIKKKGEKLISADYSQKCTADKNGRWEIRLHTPTASYYQYNIVFTEKVNGKTVDTKTVDNVLVGEVWFCSGQSNMEMPLGGFWNCPVEGANEAIAQSMKYTKSIRVATIPKVAAKTPQDRVAGKWEVCEPKNAPRFSAVGYFFATTLADMLDVPVGIINCSWGGSCVEGWLPKEILETYPDGIVPFNDTDYMQKMVMYNGMLYPLAGYGIKGFLWNQGESNIGRENQYAERFEAMVNLWRKMWAPSLQGECGGETLPIYTVELPPYWYDDVNGLNGPRFRTVQHKIANELKNSGCVCTSDLVYDYEPKQIHGTKKKEIGQRLAYMALTRDYKMEGIASEAPEFEYYETVDASKDEQAVIAGSAVSGGNVNSGKILHIYFKNCYDGFDRLSDIRNFEAQAPDGSWHEATVWASSAWQNVKRQGCFLCLACPEISEIKNIRYCYKNFVRGELHDMRGLPVVPFTTEAPL